MFASPLAARKLVPLAILVALFGCRSISNMNPLGSGEGAKMSRAEFVSELRDFAGQMLGRVEYAADRVMSATDDLEVRRSAIVWKLASLAEYRRLEEQAAALEAPRRPLHRRLGLG